MWTLSPYSDPFGNQNCVYAPDNAAQGESTYHVVVSDSDDLNAVKNISSLTQVRATQHVNSNVSLLSSVSGLAWDPVCWF